MNVRPNVFEKILQPGPRGKKSKTFQLELHYRATQESNKFSVILNNMKVMCIFDWILSIRDFLMESPDDPFKQGLTFLLPIFVIICQRFETVFKINPSVVKVLGKKWSFNYLWIKIHFGGLWKDSVWKIIVTVTNSRFLIKKNPSLCTNWSWIKCLVKFCVKCFIM